jgi:hypothetical protein
MIVNPLTAIDFVSMALCRNTNFGQYWFSTISWAISMKISGYYFFRLLFFHAHLLFQVIIFSCPSTDVPIFVIQK